ncbi:glucose 1-dehydrogenase [Halalkalibacter oceani]|uniref:Glucose 1-dehydrogenase n=1 Tax=Halalkalibacter oceani TaxID=1653776 RepID=A0A9X2INH3_9BACI|nr:glucose 1-dehydrogenase [Halalkalibacter oceani]MCM3714170.1 glucose 1-dehydrogenase [Halalkalibacter oceani]
MSMFDIKGKTALITGGNRGLGKAISLAFADAGANIVVVSQSGRAEEVVEAAMKKGVRAVSIQYDLSDTSHMKELVDKVNKEAGHIDILVNNAGVQRRAPSVEFSEEDWDLVQAVNTKSVFFLCQAFGKAMLERKQGKIINLASLLSFQGGFTVPAYAASKGAVAQFTKSLANEWASQGVNVNAVAPGYIATDMNEALINDQTRSRQILERIPAGRWGQPEDIAGAVLYLATPAANYVHGEVIVVDGGWMGR